ncbi:hypothetical protein DAI22_01g210000 [Oryza sativa Japonica Group]|nr:hypothetical protein DAI22_01g210000 [Oryza sativa Japonica Group]
MAVIITIIIMVINRKIVDLGEGGTSRISHRRRDGTGLSGGWRRRGRRRRRRRAPRRGASRPRRRRREGSRRRRNNGERERGCFACARVEVGERRRVRGFCSMSYSSLFKKKNRPKAFSQ